MVSITRLFIINALILLSTGASADLPVGVRKEPKATSVEEDSPVGMAEVVNVFAEESPEELAEEDAEEEAFALPIMDPSWPVCQIFHGRSFTQHSSNATVRKLTVLTDVDHAKACSILCGSYRDPSSNTPCSSFAYVNKSWATEFKGFKSCALFGFDPKEAGSRQEVDKYTYKNAAIESGTPCLMEDILAAMKDTANTQQEELRTLRPQMKELKIQARATQRELNKALAANEEVRNRLAVKNQHSMVLLAILVVITVIGAAIAGVKARRNK